MTPTYPPPEDIGLSSSFHGMPSPFLVPEQLGMLPIPESPLPSQALGPSGHHRHSSSLSVVGVHNNMKTERDP